MENRKQFEILNYKVSGDTNFLNNLFGINEEIIQILQTMHQKVEKKKNSAIGELHNLIEKYPNVPQFKNLLSIMFVKQGNNKKANEVNHWLVAEHPDYLFGKLNLANEYIFKKQFEKVPDVLGELMEIKDLYPGRNEFHINEVVSFYRTAINYFIGVENLEAAESRLDVLKKLSHEFNDVINKEQISEIELLLFPLKLIKGHEHYLMQREKTREVEVLPVKVVEQTNEKPNFINPIIEQLYCNSMRIDHAVLKQILLLPRETLIADLHKVVYDSIARFEYFSGELRWHATTHEFLMHALHLLTELKSEESLDVLLDVLRQDEDYLECWFGDTLMESVWECFYVLGFNKLNEFKSFLFEPNHSSQARAIISEVVSQIALHNPERKNEIINWYGEIIEEILARKDDEKIIDTDWIAFIICDLLDIDAVELIPLIKKLFDEELVSEDVCGIYKGIEEEFKTKKYSYDKKMETFDNIFSRYEHIVKSWHYYANGTDMERIKPFDENEEYFEDTVDEYTDYEEMRTNTPIINSNKSIGRNDPCPCGSGKKYKKCCLK
jgi:hypothetical protein